MLKYSLHRRLLSQTTRNTKHVKTQSPETNRRPTRLIVNMSQTEVQDDFAYGLQRVTRGRKDVVTAFVRRPTDGKIVVVQRSDKVSTYQLKWGGVSGGIEGNESVIERGYDEIFEELGFSREHVEYLHSGRPLYVDDGNKHFAVHPLLFSLAPAAASLEPKMNWENVGYNWIEPNLLSNLDTVPNLSETWERVALTSKQQAALHTLKNDRIHGAAEVAKLGLQFFEEEASGHCDIISQGGVEQSLDEGTGLLDALRNWGYHLATCRPSMAPLGNTIAETLSAVHNVLHDRADAFEACNGEVCFALTKAVKAQDERLQGIATNLCEHASTLLNEDNMTLLTISYSSSVLETVKSVAKQRRIKAIVCESRPLYEGVTLAKAWAEAGIDVTVITDAQASVFVKKVDIVLTGADAVTQRAVVNKAGTHLLALAAAEAGVPVYALADTTKLTPGSIFNLAHPGGGEDAEEEDFHEEKSAKEITEGWTHITGGNGNGSGGGVQGKIKSVRNVYFEDVPLELLAGVITERGVLQPEEVSAECGRLQKLHKLAFQLD